MGRQRATQSRTAEIGQKGRTSTSQQPKSPGSDLSNALLQFQQTIGNRTVGRLLQAKLRVNQPGDKYEQEADHVADMVMRMQEPRRATEVDWESGAPGKIATGFVQRKCAVCARGQGICPKCEGDERIQRLPLAAGLTSLLQFQRPKPQEKEEDGTLPSGETHGHTPEV